MLSYRHAFHSGNHADVLKHFILAQVLEYTNQKDKPYWYIDTHAGAGMYALDSGYATQNAEYETGIAKLWTKSNLLPELSDFKALIQSFNPSGRLDLYPGSPSIAMHFLRKEDRMRLFELHPSDCKLLISHFMGKGRTVKIELEDGFAGMRAILPPPTRRAVTLIDPPYEDKEDYRKVVTCIKDNLERFATGSYLIWYPLLQRPEPKRMIEQLRQTPQKNWLHATLTVKSPSMEGFGMHGSGMFVINPPWTLAKTLSTALPALVQLLGQDSGAGFSLDYSAD